VKRSPPVRYPAIVRLRLELVREFVKAMSFLTSAKSIDQIFVQRYWSQVKTANCNTISFIFFGCRRTVAYTPFARLGQMGVYALFVAFFNSSYLTKMELPRFHSQ